MSEDKEPAMIRYFSSKTAIWLNPFIEPEALQRPLFAINWFNERLPWLYTFYNLLAARTLFRTGAKIFLKARLKETLQGEHADGRDLLLIVNYPSGEKFLDLLANSYFQFISLFRLAAVKDFSFVLQKRLDGPELLKTRWPVHDKSKFYALHHFQSQASLKGDLSAITALIEALDISLHYAGEKAAAVVIKDIRSQNPDQAMPFITHKLVLFEAGSDAALKSLFAGEPYQQFVSRLDSSFIGTLDRLR